MAVAKDKLYYKIGEACKILDIQPYVLRYWETEFPILSPSKSKSGQRVFGEDDFALVRRIKELLYDEGFTIAGAKKKLETEIAEGGPKVTAEVRSPQVVAQPTASRKPRSANAESNESSEPAKPSESKELARLRAGVAKALAEARDILDFLEQ